MQRLSISVDQQRGALRGRPHDNCLNRRRRRPPPSATAAEAASATKILRRRRGSRRLILLRGSPQLAPAEYGESAGPPQERHPRARGEDLGGERGRERQTGCARVVGSVRLSARPFYVLSCIAAPKGNCFLLARNAMFRSRSLAFSNSRGPGEGMHAT